AMTAALFSPLYMNSGYSDPADIFDEDDTVPPMPTKPSETEPSGEAPTEPSEPEPREDRVSFIAAGDNLIHEAVYTDAKNRAGGNGYNFIDMYEGVADIIKGADVAYVNQETITAGESFGIYGYPNFNTPQEAGEALIDLGFNTVNLASNHMLDRGTKALQASFDFWKAKDVTVLGSYTKSDYDNIRVQEVNGVKIAWLSFTYGINDGRTVDAGSDIVIPYINEGDIRRQAALAQYAGDIIIASMHWGTDSSLTVTSSQKQYAQLLADCGVDVIIGTHSHTLQPVEWITSSDGNHKTLCYYSLGNLISTMHYNETLVGGLATFDIVKDGDTVAIENVGVIPTMCHYSMTRDSLQIYTLEDYSEELAKAHGSQLKRSFTYDYLLSRVKDTVAAEYLPEYYK
ncbi:MAG: CapA family protein, partial [Clostridia bacterium]|nr:CapA family protein [Clostridia bacterium]